MSIQVRVGVTSVIFSIFLIPLISYAATVGALLGQQGVRIEGDGAYGMGYSTDLNKHTGHICIEPVTPTAHKPAAVGVLYANRYTALDAYQQSITKSAGIDLNFALFGLSLAGGFLQNQENDQYAESLVFITNLQFDDKVLPKGNLTLYPGYVNYIKNNKINDFRHDCGDQLNTVLHEGGELYISYQLDFRTVAAKKSFDASVKSNLKSFADFNTKVHAWEKSTHNEGSLTIQAYQAGGDPTQLSRNILNGTTQLTCQLNDLTPCDKIYQNVITYATTIFPAQFGNATEDSPKGEAIVGTEHMDYSKIDPSINIPSQLNPNIVAMRNKLAAALVVQNNESLRAEYILSLTGLPATYIAQVHAYLAARQSSISKIKTVGQECYTIDYNPYTKSMKDCYTDGTVLFNGGLPADDPTILTIPAK